MLLPVKLSEAEVNAKAQELAVTCDRIKGYEEERRETVAGINVSIKEHKHILTKLTREVRTGKEEREVPTSESTDWEHNLVHTIRVDTGETVGSRVLTASEKQQPLPMKQLKSKRKAGGDDEAPEAE